MDHGSAHAFRTTLAVDLLNKGVAVETVAAILGNSPAIVHKHNSPFVKSRQEALENALRNVWTEPKRPKLKVMSGRRVPGCACHQPREKLGRAADRRQRKIIRARGTVQMMKPVKTDEFYIRVGDEEIALRALSGGRIVKWTLSPFGTVEIIGEVPGLPIWLHDGDTVSLRQTITFEDGETLDVIHPMFNLRIVARS